MQYKLFLVLYMTEEFISHQSPIRFKYASDAKYSYTFMQLELTLFIITVSHSQSTCSDAFYSSIMDFK